MDIEAVKALSGDYQDLIISKKGIKCYGSHGSDCYYNFDDFVSHENEININIVKHFLMEDIIGWYPYIGNETHDILRRRDGKTLRIEKNLLSSIDNEIVSLIKVAIAGSIVNVIKESDSPLELQLFSNKIVIKDKITDGICLRSCHLDALDFMTLITFLLSNVLSYDDITINYASNNMPRVAMRVFNTEITLIGEEKYMMKIINCCEGYRKSLKDINRHQLKKEGI